MADAIKDVNSALKISGWRTAEQLNNMGTEDERNTLIVELHNHSNLSISQLQAKHNQGNLNSLTGMAAICYFLYSNKVRNIQQLKSMSDQDQRNTLIVELNKKVNKEIREIQGMSDLELVSCGSDFYRRDSTVRKVLKVNWDVSTAKIVDKTPEVLAQQVFHNDSDQVLTQTFSYSKKVTRETSFEHSTSINFSASVEYSFTAGIPVIAQEEVKVKVQMGTETRWTYAEKKTVSQTFETKSEFNIQPHASVRRKSTVTIAKMDVPYTMEVETETGRTTTVDGVWHGVSMFNIQETQENI